MHGIYVHANVDDLDLWCNHFDNQASNNTTVGLFFFTIRIDHRNEHLDFVFRLLKKQIEYLGFFVCLFFLFSFLQVLQSCWSRDVWSWIIVCFCFPSFIFIFILLFYLFCLISVIIALIFFIFFSSSSSKSCWSRDMRITQVIEGFFYLEFI